MVQSIVKGIVNDDSREYSTAYKIKYNTEYGSQFSSHYTTEYISKYSTMLARDRSIHRPQWIRWPQLLNTLFIYLIACQQILSVVSTSSSVLLWYGVPNNLLL